MLLIGAMMWLLVRFRAHHDRLARAAHSDAPLDLDGAAPPIAVVLLRRWDAAARNAMRVAATLAPDVVALQVVTGDGEIDDLSARWRDLAEIPAETHGRARPRLVVLRSRYRRFYSPLLRFVKRLCEREPARPVAVVVPELTPRRWYNYVFRGRTASFVRALFLFRGHANVLVVSTPYYVS